MSEGELDIEFQRFVETRSVALLRLAYLLAADRCRTAAVPPWVAYGRQPSAGRIQARPL